MGDEFPNLKALTPEENARVQNLGRETESLRRPIDAYRKRYGYRSETFWERVRQLGSAPMFAPSGLKHRFAFGKGLNFATNTTVSRAVDENRESRHLRLSAQTAGQSGRICVCTFGFG